MGSIKLFISHSHKDNGVAKQLIRLLERCYEIHSRELRCTSVDGYTLKLGVLPRDQLRDEIEGANVVALVSPNSLKSDWVFFELGAAWRGKNYVIPVLLPGIDRKDLPAAMGGLTCSQLLNEREVTQFISNLDNIIDWGKKDFEARNSAIRDFLQETKLSSIENSFFSDRSKLKEIAPDEFRFSPDWRTLREGVRSRLEEADEGDHWVLVCISPEAFSPWKEEIERAIRAGVSIDLIYNDLSAGVKLDTYWNSINEQGFDGVSKSVNSFLPSILHYQDKAKELHISPHESRIGKLTTHLSEYPHFFIACVCVSQPESKRSWALIAPYTPFKWETERKESEFVGDWGMIVERDSNLYKKYKSSALSLLRKVRD